MPVDNWLILALIMIFSSIILCAILPIIIRLWIARQRYRRYRLDLELIEYAPSDLFSPRLSIYGDPQLVTSIRRTSGHESVVYSQIPFIDEETSV